MAQEHPKNKISDANERRAEHLEDNFRKQGMGEDEAEKRAMAQAMEEEPSHGGSNTAGEAAKHGIHGGIGRRGSESNESK
jgi:hypothetical protein